MSESQLMLTVGVIAGLIVLPLAVMLLVRLIVRCRGALSRRGRLRWWNSSVSGLFGLLAHAVAILFSHNFDCKERSRKHCPVEFRSIQRFAAACLRRCGAPCRIRGLRLPPKK